jgi:hypothetical protein
MKLSDTDRQHILRTLDGEIESLVDAFEWASSPQGYVFWERQYYAGHINQKGRAALEAMLND